MRTCAAPVASRVAALCSSVAALRVVATVLAIPAALGAQPARSVAPANGTLAEEFTRITAVRELPDGRLLVVDAGENRLVIADFRADAVRVIGRTGRGPGEFVTVGRLVAARGDTSLLADAGAARRWLVLAGDSIVATLGPTEPIIEATGGSLLGADSLGRVHASSPMPFLELGGGMRRVQRFHVLADRATARLDSVAALGGFTILSRESGPAGQRVTSNFQLVHSAAEQALLFPDAWLALARQEPYRVEWRRPDGTTVRGTPLPFTPTRVDQAEKEHWLAGIRRETPNATIDLATVAFVEAYPPFPGAALTALPDGSLAILRHPTRRAPGNAYDVVDRRGTRIATITMPEGARLIGSGRASLYVVTTDADGLERLSRHPAR